MVNVFGGSITCGPGNLQVVKKVVVTVGKVKDYIDEIQQIYVLAFTPYRLHKNVDGTFETPLLFMMGRYIYIGRCCHDGGWRSISYVLDDVATMEVGDRYHMYWTMLARWRLAIYILQRIQ